MKKRQNKHKKKVSCTYGALHDVNSNPALWCVWGPFDMYTADLSRWDFCKCTACFLCLHPFYNTYFISALPCMCVYVFVWVCVRPKAFKPQKGDCKMINTSPQLIEETGLVLWNGIDMTFLVKSKARIKCNFWTVNWPRHSVILPAAHWDAM